MLDIGLSTFQILNMSENFVTLFTTNKYPLIKISLCISYRFTACNKTKCVLFEKVGNHDFQTKEITFNGRNWQYNESDIILETCRVNLIAYLKKKT